MTDELNEHPLPTVTDAIDLRDALIETLVENQHGVLRMVRRWLIAGFLVLAVGVALVLYSVGLIRTTQNQHSPIVVCQTKAIDGLLKDVPLAFSGDKTRGDYAPIPSHCAIGR